MKACKKCGVVYPPHRFYTNSNGNLTGACTICITAQQRIHYHHVKKARERERMAQIEQQSKRDKDALAGKRPCAIFPGYLFSGDVA